MKILTQNERVLDYLKRKGVASTKDIQDVCRLTRAPARIYDLRKMGHKIEKLGLNEHRFMNYKLISKA